MQEEAICVDFAFVSEGLLKSYVLDEKGNENVNLFGWKGWWMADFQSFLFQTPDTLAIEAMEDGEFLKNKRRATALLFRYVIIAESLFAVL